MSFSKGFLIKDEFIHQLEDFINRQFYTHVYKLNKALMTLNRHPELGMTS